LTGWKEQKVIICVELALGVEAVIFETKPDSYSGSMQTTYQKLSLGKKMGSRTAILISELLLRLQRKRMFCSNRRFGSTNSFKHIHAIHSFL